MVNKANNVGTVFNIQVLRFFAAAMVLFGHLEHEVRDRQWLSQANFTPFDPVFWPGGVDIFFVVSGFIMYYISANQFGRTSSALEFLKRRFIRILPPYWFYTTLMIVAAVVASSYIAHPAINLTHIIGSYFLFPVRNPYGSVYPFLIIGWTLEYEVFFYLIFAVGLLFKRPIGVFVICGLLLALAGVGLTNPHWVPLQYWSNSIVLEFIFGIALAHLRLSGVRWPLWVALLISGLGVVWLVLLQRAGLTAANWGLRWAWMGLPALQICAGLALQKESDKPGRLKKLLVFGGDASYSLYLSHPFTLNAIAVVAKTAGVKSPNLYIALSFVASIAVACVAYIWVERPLYRWFTNLAARPKSVPREA